MKARQYLLIIVALIFTTQLKAQVYKCTFVDAPTRQNKVIYSDMPCQQAHKQTRTTIQTQLSLNQKIASANAINLGVTRAVLNRDFKLAKSIAATKEHWRLIAMAEGEAAPILAVVNNPPAPLASSSAMLAQAQCAQAKYDFEYISRTLWRDKDLVAAKKSLMYASCGVTTPEPIFAQNRPIFIGNSYNGFNGGGINSGRLFYPNALPFQHGSYGSFGHHTYPLHNVHFGQQQTGSISLQYRNKHFGLNANSGITVNSASNTSNGINFNSGINNSTNSSINNNTVNTTNAR